MQEKIQQNWTIQEVLTWTSNRFKQADIETPLLDAQLLLCKVLNTKKINLYMDYEKPLTSAERSHLRDFVKRRLDGEPVAYILNEKHWYDLVFYVDNRVLIPRPETEYLLDFVIESFKYLETQSTLLSSIIPPNTMNTNSKLVIYDFCTGSGCLAIALAKAFPHSAVVGIDLSKDALTVAEKNAQLNNITNVQWVNLDLSQTESYIFLKEKYGSANIITANPPYVSEEEWKRLDISVKDYEPKVALTSPEDGLFIGKEIIKNVEELSLLNNNLSIFAMEMGVGHPQKLISHPIKNHHYHSKAYENTKNEWFSLSDLDNKNRFLCHIKI